MKIKLIISAFILSGLFVASTGWYIGLNFFIGLGGVVAVIGFLSLFIKHDIPKPLPPRTIESSEEQILEAEHKYEEAEL